MQLVYIIAAKIDPCKLTRADPGILKGMSNHSVTAFFAAGLFVLGVAINESWSEGSTLTLDWTGKFTSPTPLYFELSIGTQLGSGRLRKWVELSVAQTSYSVSDGLLERSEDYFITLTAISSSGLHTTAIQLIASLPLGM